MKLFARTISLVAILALGLALPGAAMAGKKNNKKKGGSVANVEQPGDVSDHPGNGLGPGGVPALRDEVVEIGHQVDVLEENVDALDGRVGDLENGVSDGFQMLADMIEGLRSDLGLLEDRVAALEVEATDDDGDGYSENLGDCNDDDALVGPAAEEIVGNGIDDDCDFEIDEAPAVEPVPL